MTHKAKWQLLGEALEKLRHVARMEQALSGFVSSGTRFRIAQALASAQAALAIDDAITGEAAAKTTQTRIAEGVEIGRRVGWLDAAAQIVERDGLSASDAMALARGVKAALENEFSADFRERAARGEFRSVGNSGRV
jgi:hypothetical protein